MRVENRRRYQSWIWRCAVLIGTITIHAFGGRGSPVLIKSCRLNID